MGTRVNSRRNDIQRARNIRAIGCEMRHVIEAIPICICQMHVGLWTRIPGASEGAHTLRKLSGTYVFITAGRCVVEGKKEVQDRREVEGRVREGKWGRCVPVHLKHFFCKYGESSDLCRYKNNGYCLRGSLARLGIYLLVNPVATMQLSRGRRERGREEGG